MASTVATRAPSWTSWPTVTSSETSFPASGLVTSPAPGAWVLGAAAATGAAIGAGAAAGTEATGAGGAEIGAPAPGISSITSTFTSYALPSTVTFSLFMIIGGTRSWFPRQQIRWSWGVFRRSGPTRGGSQRDVAVFLRRPGFALGQRVAQGHGQDRTRLRRFDDVGDHPLARGLVRRGKFLAVLGGQLLFLGLGIAGRADLAFEKDLHGALGAHHRNLSRRPRIHSVRSHVAAAHGEIGSAVRFAKDEGQLWHGGRSIRKQHFRAMADDATPFLGNSGQKSRDVHEGDDREVEHIAETNEPGG